MGAIVFADETKADDATNAEIVIDEAQMLLIQNTTLADPIAGWAGEVSVTEIGRWQLVIDQAELSVEQSEQAPMSRNS